MMVSRLIGTDFTVDDAKRLLNSGANVNHTNVDGKTVLMMGVRCSEQCEGKSTFARDITQVLLNAGANVNHRNNDGWSSLSLAVCNSHTDSSKETVKLLIEAGADVNVQ